MRITVTWPGSTPTLNIEVDGGQVIPILETERFGNFVRTSPLDKPLPFIIPRPLADNLDDMYRYEFLWTDYNKESQARIKKYCNDEGRMLYGTSLWFENIVGHRSTPEELIFK